MNFLKYHFPALLYASIIIILSSIPKLTLPTLRYFAFDKVAHFFEYAIFAILTFRSFSHIHIKIKNDVVFWYSAVFIGMFAIFDEYFIQSLSRRTSSINDLFFDYGGALVVLLILWFRKK